MSQEYHDKVLSDLVLLKQEEFHREKYFDSAEFQVTVDVNLEFMDRIPNYDNKDMPFFNTYHVGDDHKEIYTVNEHMAVLLSIVMNTVVILVFVRVLGLARLPSRLVVNLAAVNIVSSIGHLLHRESVSVAFVSNTVNICRFVALFNQECNTLFLYSLSGMMVERIIACSLPSYYCRAQHILCPCIIVSPWVLWVIDLILLNMDFFEYDAGYECGNHMNMVHPDAAMYSGVRCATIIAILLLSGLGLTTVMHNQSSGDIWDKNRTKFEMRTTKVVLKLMVLVTVFTLPSFISRLYVWNGLTYEEARIMHMAWQLSVHRGISLIIVMLTRREFRRHIFLVFESSESIRRNRTTNLLIAHRPTRYQFYKFAGSSSYTDEQSEDRSSGILHHQQQPMMGWSGASVGHTGFSNLTPICSGIDRSLPVHGGLISRDKITAIETPEWLLKKEPEPTLSKFKLYGLRQHFNYF